MTEQIISIGDTHIAVSPNKMKELIGSLVETFERVKDDMNPTKSIVLRRIIQSTQFNINEYIQPSRIFDIKRLWKNAIKKKCRKHERNHQIKMNPLKGFQDPLKLKKKCLLKMPSVPGQPFILIYDNALYVPPVNIVPPHILSVERNLPKLTTSLMFSETEVLGKYITPCVLKVKARLKSLTLVKAHKIPDFPTEFINERYHAPPGSKENYTCRNFPDIKAADKALKDASIYMNRPAILHKSMLDSSQQANLPHRDSQSLTKLNVIQDPDGDADSVIDDLEWTKLRRRSSTLFSESESESDPLVTIAEYKHSEKKGMKGTTPCSNEIGDGIEHPRNDYPNANMVIEIINMTKDKPHVVRRILKESPSVSEWIYEKIISTQSESCLDKYQPPIPQEIQESNSTSNQILRQRHELRSKSCCTLGTSSDSLECVSIKEVVSDASVDVKVLRRRNERTELHSIRNKDPPKSVNSIDEVLKLRVTDPVEFCVLRTLCSKKFHLYESDTSRQTQMQIPVQAPFCKLRKSNIRERRRKLLSSLRQQHSISITDEEFEEGYLGSEEDEEYKCQILNDFWPIRSQCTAQDSCHCHSRQSTPEFSDNYCSNSNLDIKPNDHDHVLIEYDDAEYWAWISAYENLFSQSDHPTIGNLRDDTIFCNYEEVQKVDKPKFRAHRTQARLRRCMSKILTWCKNGLIKNL